MLCTEHPFGKRIFCQSTMAKDVLIRHLNTVGPLCSDLLDSSSYVYGSSILQSRYANVQGAKCTWKCVNLMYILCLNFYVSGKNSHWTLDHNSGCKKYLSTCSSDTSATVYNYRWSSRMSGPCVSSTSE